MNRQIIKITKAEVIMKKLKHPEFKIAKEFKAFITKGNVIDLAVGLIIGAAFTAIVTALVNSIFKPLISVIPMQGVEGLITMLVAKDANGIMEGAAGYTGVIDLTKSIYIDWGAFIMAVVNFLLTALVLFAIIKVINRVRGGFGEIKGSAGFLITLSKEEIAELKAKGFSKKEIKALKQKRAQEAEEAAQAAVEEKGKAETGQKGTSEDLLREIRDLLRAQADKTADDQN